MLGNKSMTHRPQTYLGFDFGSKIIGVASGETLTQHATPLPFLTVKHNAIPWDAIQAMIKDHQPSALVVGWPCDPTEQPLPLAGRVKHFATELHNQTQLPIYLENEHLTSKEARSRIHQRYGANAVVNHKIDSIAACIILESFLSRHTNCQPFLPR